MVKFQVIQYSLDELVINIQSDPLTDEEKVIIKRELVEKFGKIKTSINNVFHISSSDTGKFKAIISYVTNPKQ